jgi:uncharacterized protein (DUF4415 family)
MSNIVRKTMTEILEDKATSDTRLYALADLPDEEIDLSDIPEAGEEFWKNARPMRDVMAELTARHAKAEPVTLKLDGDVLAWLKREGESRVDARANALLRDAMEHERLKKSA